MGYEGLESALCCSAQAPLLGFVLSAKLVVGTWHLAGLHKLWVNLGCRAAVFSSIFVRAHRSRWRNVLSHTPSQTHAQCFASASTWSRAGASKNGLSSLTSASTKAN